MSPAIATTFTLRLTRTYAASRERIFRAWTDPQELVQWFRPTDEYQSRVLALDARPGGTYMIEMVHRGGNVSRVSGRFIDVMAPERLAFTWKFDTMPGAVETLVTVELRESAGGTELTLTHERFPTEEQSERHKWGWTGSLEQLARRYHVMTIMQELIEEFDREAPATRRALEALPEEKLSWRPHPKSYSLGQLAMHIATVPGMLVMVQALDNFAVGEFRQAEPSSKQEILDTFEKSLQAVHAELAKIDDQRALSLWTMSAGDRVIMQVPRKVFVRTIMMNHVYHHRGQLSVYLRLLDVPVPSIYGPSADVNPFA